MNPIETILNIALIVIIIYFFIINTIYLSILFLSIMEINRRKKNRFTFDLMQAFKFRLLPPVSIILPAYNEEKTIVESIRSLLFVRYPLYELIVINDGSKDKTLSVMQESFNLIKTDYICRDLIETENIRGIYTSKEYQNIIVIDKENGGKADALNTGINISRYPYFCAVDADTILGEDALAKLILPFVNDPARTTAVGGVVRPANGADIQRGRLMKERLTKNILVILQSIEYARAFYMGRMGLSAINSLLIISGAFGLFKKEDVLKVKGYKKKSLGEDMMLVVQLHKLKKKEKKKYRITFVPDTVCWTEIPSSVRVLKKQRIRWQMGLIESIMDNKDMFFNPKYGNIGLFSIPFYFFSEIIPPFIEIIGYIIMAYGIFIKAIPLYYAINFFLVTWIYSGIHSSIAIVLEHYGTGTTLNVLNFVVKGFVSLLENLFYRQLNLIYRIAGVFTFLTKKREWGSMEREGFTTVEGTKQK